MHAVPAPLVPLLERDVAAQRAFAFPVDRWRAWTGAFAGVGPVLDELPTALDRRETACLVHDLLPDNVAGAFVVSMIWGHGTSGYGPYRTASVLTGTRPPASADASPGVLGRLATSVETARGAGAAAGYRYLNNRPGKISGLGPAFLTKWLYFVTARGDAESPTAAPVLDALVIRWLGSHSDLALRAGRTDDYARYIETLSAWGARTP